MLINSINTINSFKNLQKWEISWQSRRSGGWGKSFSGRVGRNGTHLSTNFITSSQLLKLFIEPILMNVLLWTIDLRFSWNFRRPPTLTHFSIWEWFQCRQKCSPSKKTFIFLLKTFVEPSLTSKMEPFAKIPNS